MSSAFGAMLGQRLARCMYVRGGASRKKKNRPAHCCVFFLFVVLYQTTYFHNPKGSGVGSIVQGVGSIAQEVGSIAHVLTNEKIFLDLLVSFRKIHFTKFLTQRLEIFVKKFFEEKRKKTNL